MLPVGTRFEEPIGLSAVVGSVRAGELFLDRFPGRMAWCGLNHTVERRKLDLCYGSTGRSDHYGVLESKVTTRLWLDFHELSRSVQT